MPLPNFIIVGAAKAGTTSLYRYLEQHPQVYMSPVKEPRYFAPEYYTTFYHNAIGNQHREGGMPVEEYEALFDGVRDEIAIGEASTEYLFFEKSAERIKSTIPHAKIVMVLRDPVERAFSAYCYHLRDGRETLPFEEALAQESARAGKEWQVGWFYRQGGLYYEQVKRYYDLFDPKQIKIIIWKDLNENPRKICADLFKFLNVDDSFTPDLSRSNQSAIPRNQLMNRYLFKNRRLKQWIKAPVSESIYLKFSNPLKKLFYTKKQSLRPDIRNDLRNSYQADISKLSALTSIDLSGWKPQQDEEYLNQPN